MALIKCPECGNDVSSTTYKCPHCGFVINEPKRSFVGNIFETIFVLFNFLMVAIIGTFIFNIMESDSDSAAMVGLGGVGTFIFLWVLIGLPLGIMSYITRAKAGN